MDTNGLERRSGQRFNADMDVEWESAGVRFPGVLSDIGTNGCFILCSGGVADGAGVSVFVPSASSGELEFAGEVANSTPEVGFAVRFRDLSGVQMEFIASLIDSE